MHIKKHLEWVRVLFIDGYKWGGVMEYFEIVDAVEAERETARLVAFFNSRNTRGVFFYRCRKSAVGVWIRKGNF